jgi:HD-like signal output (HDOD) protein
VRLEPGGRHEPPVDHAHNVLHLVPDAAATLVGADRAAVLVHWQGQYVLVSTCGEVPFPIGLRSHGLPAALLRVGGPSVMQELRHDGRHLGLLWVARDDGLPFSSETQRILEQLASVATLALCHPPPSPGPMPLHHVGAAHPAVVRDGELAVPAFPPMLARIVSLADDEDTTPAELVAAVSADPVLVAQAMRVASAPALARSRPPRSVKEAVMVLGLRGVRNLAMGQFARSLFARWGTVDQLLWEHALGTAVGMHLLLAGREPSAAEDAYLCGLLHNLGMIVRHNAEPERYERVIARAVVGPSSWSEVETREFGSSSLTVLPHLLSGWHLPGDVGRRLRDLALDRLDGAIGRVFAWAWPLALEASPAWHLALGPRPAPAWLAEAAEAGRTAAGVPGDRMEALAGEVAARCATLRRLLG